MRTTNKQREAMRKIASYNGHVLGRFVQGSAKCVNPSCNYHIGLTSAKVYFATCTHTCCGSHPYNIADIANSLRERNKERYGEPKERERSGLVMTVFSQ